MTTLEQIKDFIDNTNKPFSAGLIAQKLRLNIVIARYHLPKLYAEKYIKLVRIDNHTKYYISIKNQEKAFVSNFDMVKNYVKQSIKPFTHREITQELGLKYQVVNTNLNILVLEGDVIQIDFDRSTKLFISKSNAGIPNFPVFKSSYQKIKNYVENANEPFTAIKLATELRLSPSIVRKYLSILLKGGHIKMIEFDKSTKTFISKRYQDGCFPDTSIMTSYDKIMNFIDNLNEPFTVKQIINELCLTYDTIMIYIPKMLAKGYIKLVGRVNNEHIYISNNYHGQIPTITSYDKIKNYIYYSNLPFTVKQIANEIGLPHQLVRRYMPKMLTEGYIKLIGLEDHIKVYIRNRYYGKKRYVWVTFNNFVLYHCLLFILLLDFGSTFHT